MENISPDKWSTEHPVGSLVRYRGSREEHRVASRAFWTTGQPIMVLLDNGHAVGIDGVERVPNRLKSDLDTTGSDATWKSLALRLASEAQTCLDNAHWEVKHGSGDLLATIKAIRLRAEEAPFPRTGATDSLPGKGVLMMKD